MKQNSEYRTEARNALEGNWGDAALVAFLAGVVELVLSTTFQVSGIKVLGEQGSGAFSIGASILALPMEFGFLIIFLRLLRRQSQSYVKELFSYYNGRVFLTMVLRAIYTVLWTLLFIIPGIVKSYSYAMTEYVMYDNPELKNNAAIEKSMEMMKGKKMKLFLLDLSFIGWGILCIFTLGFGLILLMPYIATTRAAFYEDLKAELDPQPKVTEEV